MYMKKILSLLTACSLVFSMTGAAYAAVPDDIYEDSAEDHVFCESEDTAETEDYAAPESVPVSDMSMDEVLGIVEEAARKADACEEYVGGVCGVELTEEEAEAEINAEKAEEEETQEENAEEEKEEKKEVALDFANAISKALDKIEEALLSRIEENRVVQV